MALRLGEILVEKGIITATELELAITQQQKTKKLLGQILLQMGYCRFWPNSRESPLWS